MSSETETISCIKEDCGQKLRVPANRGRLFVTCPKCRTAWQWTAETPSPAPITSTEQPTPAEPIKPARRTRRTAIALWVIAVLIVVAGVWNGAWLPAGLFVLAFLVRRICRDKLLETDPKTLWQKGAGVLYEATAGVCSAIAIGLGAVIALITFLNVYPHISPTNYPPWLLKLETLLITISAWTQTANNKLRITIVYLSVIVLCFILSLLPRRYQKEWRPVASVTRFKQTANKALLAIWVITFFSFFSHTPIDKRVAELAQQRAWRFGVAKRVEQELEAKRLVAEALTEAVRAQKNVDEDDKDVFAQWFFDVRSQLPTPQPITGPAPPGDPSSGYPTLGPRDRPPSNWPRPPDAVLKKIRTGEPLVASDYDLPPRVAPDPKPMATTAARADNSRFAEVNKVVANQIEPAIPREVRKPLPDPVQSDTQAAKIFPPKTTDQWQTVNALLAEQELKVEHARRRYGEAVQVLLEGFSEFLSMQVGGDPIVGTWIDLALSEITDRVYDDLFAKESGRFVKVTDRLRALLTPRETKAARLKERIEILLGANELDAAESLISQLESYPKTKAGKLANTFAEDASFRRVSRNLSSSDVTVETASKYLSHHPQAKRAVQVREWLAAAQAEIAQRAEIPDRPPTALKPQMLVYLRQKCPMSMYYRRETAFDGDVIAERSKFDYQVLDIDQTPPTVNLGEGERALPIIVFKDRSGQVLEVLTGETALRPTSLTMHMRAVAAGTPLTSRLFTEVSPGTFLTPESGRPRTRSRSSSICHY